MRTTKLPPCALRIQALGPDTVAEIARGAHVPQAQVRLFRNGLTTLDPKAIAALAGAVSAIETARADGGDNVVQFPAAKTEKPRTEKRRPRHARRMTPKPIKPPARRQKATAPARRREPKASPAPLAGLQEPQEPKRLADQADRRAGSRWRGSRGR